jgi:hypothetical protein
MGLAFGFGVQRLIDAAQRYVRASKPIYYRYRNFTDQQQVQAVGMGFAISPSGSFVGTIDLLIDPPPQYVMISLHNIGMSEGKLRFGARRFVVSQSFVSQVIARLNLDVEEKVWRGPQFVGLVTDGQLFSVEDLAKQVLAGSTIVWELTANSNELR